MKKSIDVESVRLHLADLCSRSEQCESDLRKRLYRTTLSNSEKEEIISFLKQNGFLDDLRYARAFARDKVRFSGWGKKKIRLALITKKIAPDNIAEGLRAIEDNDYIEAIRRSGTAKARNLDLSKKEDTAKFVRHLLSKGFESSLIFQLLEALRYSEKNY